MNLLSPPILAASPISLEFLSPLQAAGLFAGLALPILLLGCFSMRSFGPIRKWVAIGLRLALLLVLLLILAGVRWQREAHDLDVMFVRDVSESTTLVSDFPGNATPGQTVQTALDRYFEGLSKRPDKPPGDRVGEVSFQDTAGIDALPSQTLNLSSGAIRGAGNGTDAASAIQLALATLDKDHLHRLVLAFDGNSTAGDLPPALDQAASLGVPIDVMPLRYNVMHEVMLDGFNAPTWRRENEPFTLDISLTSTNSGPVGGTLRVTHQGEPLDMDPYTPGLQPTRHVTLQPGKNVEHVQVLPLRSGGVHDFRAMFEPDPPAPGQPPSDTLAQNDSAEAFTFVRGKGRILYVDNVPAGGGDLLVTALASEGVEIRAQDHITPDAFPADLVQLQDFDCVVLANVPRGAGGLGEQQQENLASYVHDLGGGIVMIGGDQAFGAGGWQGSKLEQVLPVDMDIPAQRQVGKGALVLIMHACEFANGNYWGEQCGLKAIETLSARDDIGVISYSWSGQNNNGSNWDFPLGEKGDGGRPVAAVKAMVMGDMPSFDDTMNTALNGSGATKGLKDDDAQQKHVIIISDGDPQAPNAQLIQQYQQAKVSVSTVSVYPHEQNGQLPPTMKDIATRLHGKAYGPINGNFSQLPQIFIKEATIVRRSLIYEEHNAPFIPLKLTPTSSDIIKNVNLGQPVLGMVLTTKKSNPNVEVPVVAGKRNDVLLATWQAGLGKATVYTSDATNKWGAYYAGQSDFGKLWAQVIRGTARAPMSGDFDVRTSQSNGRGHVAVEAMNHDNAFLNFLNIHGSVLGPDGKTQDIRLTQTAPGIYEADFPAGQQGVYALGLQYAGQGDAGTGTLRGGLVVNDSPELRDLRSNDAVLQEIADRTGGRMLPAFDPTAPNADIFTRTGLRQTSSPMPVWDLLIPVALALLILDVAVRRIAWDWSATQRLAASAAQFIRGYTLSGLGKRTAATQTLSNLREARQPPPASPPAARPNPAAKFDPGTTAIEGDLSNLLRGATRQPVPSAPKNPQPKGGGDTAGMSGLMAAKRRAQQRIRDQEQGKS